MIALAPPVELDLPGFARLFEGEGTVGIAWPHGRDKRATFSLRIQMVDEDVIRAVHASFGGTICTFARKDRPQNKPLWQWAIQGEKAANLGVSMLPYLFQRRREQMLKGLDIWAGTKYQFDPELKLFRRSCEGES